VRQIILLRNIAVTAHVNHNKTVLFKKREALPRKLSFVAIFCRIFCRMVFPSSRSLAICFELCRRHTCVDTVCTKSDAKQLYIRLLEGVCFGITENKKDERTKTRKKERKAPHYQKKKRFNFENMGTR